MKNEYSVAIVGMGKRGTNHFKHFQKHDSFRVVGVCDSTKCLMPNGVFVTDKFESLLKKMNIDVLCICTPPSHRLKLIEFAVNAGVKLIAMEKPLALSSMEAMKIKKLLEKKNVKAVVCHQHMYGKHYQKVKEHLDHNAVGKIHTVYGTGLGWMMHLMPHLVHYILWFIDNKEAQWVMAQAAGRHKLTDNHPSPDYIAGVIQFTDGVRGIVECGAGAPDVKDVEYWWRKCRIGAQGAHGFAEVYTGNGWRMVNSQGITHGTGAMDYDLDMPGYIDDIAAWLNDDSRVHPCNFQSAYRGFEIMMGFCRSAIFGGQVSLPLTEGIDELKLLEEILPDSPLLFSLSENKSFYT